MASTNLLIDFEHALVGVFYDLLGFSSDLVEVFIGPFVGT